MGVLWTISRVSYVLVQTLMIYRFNLSYRRGSAVPYLIMCHQILKLHHVEFLSARLCLWACAVLLYGKYLSVVQYRTNEELQNISMWLKVNKLFSNNKKTHFFWYIPEGKDEVDFDIDAIKTNEESSTMFKVYFWTINSPKIFIMSPLDIDERKVWFLRLRDS